MMDDETYDEVLATRLATARAQRAQLVRAVEDMRIARSLTVSDDEHDPEGSTVSLDHARDTALLQQAERTVAELVAAQERHVAGRYGVCVACHDS